MSKVIYTGTSDFQEFSAQDFRKADVDDQNKVVFAQGQPTEVSEAAAQALTSEDGIFGDHSFELSDEGDNAGQGGTTDTSDSNATTEGTANPPATGNVGRGSTGRGTSTRGASR